MTAVYGYKDNIKDLDGAVRVDASISGKVRIRIRPADDGIYIGGYNVTGPTNGFPLDANKDFVVDVVCSTGSSTGSSDTYGVYIVTQSETDIDFSVFVTQLL